MSTLEAPRAHVLRDPSGRATAAAATLWLAGLAVAVGSPASDARVPLALTGAGTVLALFVLVPRAARAVRRHPVVLAVAFIGVLALLAIPLLGIVLGGPLQSLLAWPVQLLPFVIVAVAVAGGLVLLADDLRTRLGSGQRAWTPWQRLSAGPDAAAARRPWRAVAGLALVALAGILGLGLLSAYAGGGLEQAVLLLAVAGVALAVVGAPVLIAALARADAHRVTAAREDERLHVAAHLHDSVLQTLALVQRQAHDPAAVARLARRQEFELRAWLAGEIEPGSDTLGGALRAAVAEVEDEHGATVEVTILGDRPLDRRAEALAAAAREALRNAARHAPGSRIFVFAQAGPDGAEAFVRDEGAGFELGAVPTERRGVRDAIIGRMGAAGGHAAVESVPGEGTEVVLRIGTLGSRS